MNKKILLIIPIVLGSLFAASFALAASDVNVFRSIAPSTDATYDIGSSTSAWNNAYIQNICLSGDCRTTWPTGGGGGSFPFGTATTFGTTTYATTTPTLWFRSTGNSLFASGTIQATNINLVGIATTTNLVIGTTTITVKQGDSIQTALTRVAAAGGGTVYVQNGTYPQTTTLTMSSNTTLACEQGANITFDSSGWGGANNWGVTNTNNAASSITDTNIRIQGCKFTALGTFVSGNYHHVHIRMAQHVWVDKAQFVDGGDGTAFLASDDTHVTNSTMATASNACWDHWEGPTNAHVENNHCQASLYAILFTGSSTAGSGQAASSSVITNNTIKMVYGTTVSNAAIWLNGLNVAGAGASNSVVSNNVVNGDGNTRFTCIKVSGSSTNNVLGFNTCENSTSTVAAIVIGSDAGGKPSNTTVIGNIIKDYHVNSSDIGVMTSSGTSTVFMGNRIQGTDYPSCFYISGYDNQAFFNSCDGGTGTRFNVSGATSQTIIDPYLGQTLFSQGFVSAASSTIGAGTAATGLTVNGTATSTNVVITGSTNGLLKTNTIGLVSVATPGTDYQTFGYPFTNTTYSGTAVAATSTPLWLTATTPYSLIASSSLMDYASTTGLSASGNITVDGKVGIGSTTPNDALSIYTNSGTTALTLGSGTTPSRYQRISTDGFNLYVNSAGGGATIFQKSGTAIFGIQGINSGTASYFSNPLLVGSSTAAYARLMVWDTSASPGTDSFLISNAASTTTFKVDSFGNAKLLWASTTALSSFGPLYAGGTATTTIWGTATSTFNGGVNFSTGGITLSTVKNCNTSTVLTTDANGVVICGSVTGGTSASSTLLADNNTFSGTDSFTGTLKVPNAATPSLSATGAVSINTTAASSSLTYYDGTASRNLYDTFDKPAVYASSTLAYDAGASGTTTYNIWNPSRNATLVGLYCKTDTGTATYSVGTGSATSTAICSTTGTYSATTVSFNMRANVFEAFGNYASSPNRITVTPTFRFGE